MFHVLSVKVCEDSSIAHGTFYYSKKSFVVTCPQIVKMLSGSVLVVGADVLAFSYCAAMILNFPVWRLNPMRTVLYFSV